MYLWMISDRFAHNNKQDKEKPDRNNINLKIKDTYSVV